MSGKKTVIDANDRTERGGDVSLPTFEVSSCWLDGHDTVKIYVQRAWFRAEPDGVTVEIPDRKSVV